MTVDHKKEKLLENFNKAKARLNEKQKLAVDKIEGPVIVVAGPGTGKTQILTLRIANILLKTDTRPENILALTFTDSGVRAMRERLRSFLGSQANSVNIFTFHSFSNELISLYPDSYQNIVGGRVATELEKYAIIEEILETGGFKTISPLGDKTHYVKPILSAISTLKRENILPDDFSTLVQKQASALEQMERYHEKGAYKGKEKGDYKKAEKVLEKNQELLQVYRIYMATLREKRLYDFEDMILDTVQALETNEEMRLLVQEEYQYILADEHQDVNGSQNALINVIASYHKNPNVFVVGDEKQAIYRFQGASLENFLFFEDIYPGVLQISLEDNYRSGQKILDTAFEGIKTEDEVLQKLRIPLKANNKEKTEIKYFEFSHLAIENSWLIEKVKEQHEKGVPWSEQAVIVRKNQEVEEFMALFKKADIPASSSVQRDVLKHPIFLNLKLLISAVVLKNNDVALSEILLRAPYLKLDSVDILKVFSGKKSGENILEIIRDKDRLEEIGVQNSEPFLHFSELIEKVKAKEVTNTPAEVLEFLLKDSGFIDHILKNSTFDTVSIIRRLYDEAELVFKTKTVKNLTEFLRYLDKIEEYDLALSTPTLSETKDAVQIMTAHKAKGLEFDTVFLPHVTERVWNSKGRADLFKLPISKLNLDEKNLKKDDEKRLFFVALTRAKNTLFFSSAKQDEEGREESLSSLLTEVEDFVEKDEGEVRAFEKNYSLLEVLETKETSQIKIAFLKQVLETRGWSATALNNYLKSPYDYIFKNALKVPSVKNISAKFGTAVHAVLQELVRLHFAKKETSASVIKDLLDKELEKGSFSSSEFAKSHEEGFSALLVFWEELKLSLGEAVKTEYKVEAMLETGLEALPEVKLTGNFDRVDLDKDGQFIRVVDYKTGKQKSRNEIEGLTKNSDGNYKRQLVFYALLLSLQNEEKMWTDRGMLSFVIPKKETGKTRNEEFVITKAEIADLKAEIISATDTLISGKFLENPCEESESEYCFLKELFLD